MTPAPSEAAQVRHERGLRTWVGRVWVPIAVLAVNVWICCRLFHTEYLDQMLSIEGAFIALERYIGWHWNLYSWFPVWGGGYPFARTYQPLLHYTVAAASRITGASPALTYHFITALTYSLGGVAFYFLAKSLVRSRWAAFCGAMLFSTFSPSLVLMPGVAKDTWGWENARRLKTLVVFGEGPNITGLMLAMFALVMVHRALERRTAGRTILAAISIALVPATNWPATLGLMMALAAYALALSASRFRADAGRVALMGLIAIGLVIPLALPSTILSTSRNTNWMETAPTIGPARWIGFLVVVVAAGLIRVLLARAPFAIRFAALFSALTAGIVLTAYYAHVFLLPQPMRFHVAMEIGITLLVVSIGYSVCARRPSTARAALAATLAFCILQAWHYRKYARSIIHSVEIATTLEYQEARWYDANAHGMRVDAPGSVSFWMNVFTDMPQLRGCCQQSLPSREDFIASFVTAAGFHSDAESAEYSLLWEKAFAVEYFGVGGPGTREFYHSVSFPYRFRGTLAAVWQNGDDIIYRIPERTHGLARVVRASDIVRDPPENGIDVKELRPFVAALDEASLPVASSSWQDSNHVRIRASMKPDQVISVAMNYVAGWTAAVSGRPAVVRGDGLGLMVIEPHCDGDCTIDLKWSAGAEPWVCVAISSFTMIGCFVWWRRAHSTEERRSHYCG